MNQPALREIILEEANKCVLCGLCLTECPTFSITRREGQSPRGRIAYAKALAEKKLPAGKNLIASLASCLWCQACEKACPSKVGFRKMMLATESLLAEDSAKSSPGVTRQGIILRTIVRLAKKPRRLGLLIAIYKKSGLRWLLQKSYLLKLLNLHYIDVLLPDSRIPAVDNRLNTKKNNLLPEDQVGLFAGCLSQAFDQLTIDSARKIFNALGMNLVMASRPVCCGALGKTDPDQQQYDEPDSAYPDDIQAIVSCVSGCTTAFSEKLTGGKSIPDISDFLSQQDFQNLKFKNFTGVIGVHEPCSLRYPLATQHSVYTLLERIPDATVLSLPENNMCCGGAGDYLFRQPVMANKLRENKLSAMKALQPAPDVIVTSNLGCSLTLQAGLKAEGRTTEVIHPVTLLARQLEA